MLLQTATDHFPLFSHKPFFISSGFFALITLVCTKDSCHSASRFSITHRQKDRL